MIHIPNLLNLAHYLQPPNIHPPSRPIPLETVCVELLTGGRGWVEIEGTWTEVTEGVLLWHRPGEFTIGRSDFPNPYRCLAARFESVPDLRLPPRLSFWSDFNAIAELTKEVVGLFYDDFHRPTLGAYVFSRLQIVALQYHARDQGPPVPAGLRKVLRMIEKDPGHAPSLPEMAEIADWSLSHFHARFREHVGCSPHQHVLHHRIRSAKMLLSSTNAPIKQIAVDCGFSQSSAFCLAFQKSTGQSPGAFRRDNRVF